MGVGVLNYLKNKYNKWRLQRLRRKIDKVFDDVYNNSVNCWYGDSVLSRGYTLGQTIWIKTNQKGDYYTNSSPSKVEQRIKYIKAYKAIREEEEGV